jgi:hypothetical protein
MTARPDPDALLVALVLAPATFSRNKFFEMFEEPELSHARRRAQFVRSVIKELTEPWPHPGEIPGHTRPVIENQSEEDGHLHMTYRVDEFEYRRTAVLDPVEAAAFRYALHRVGHGEVRPADRALVEACLAKMNPV